MVRGRLPRTSARISCSSGASRYSSYRLGSICGEAQRKSQLYYFCQGLVRLRESAAATSLVRLLLRRLAVPSYGRRGKRLGPSSAARSSTRSSAGPSPASTVEVDGAALKVPVAERRKRCTFPELATGRPQKLLVLRSEIGGRWSTAAQCFVRDLGSEPSAGRQQCTPRPLLAGPGVGEPFLSRSSSPLRARPWAMRGRQPRYLGRATSRRQRSLAGTPVAVVWASHCCGTKRARRLWHVGRLANKPVLGQATAWSP